MLPLGLTHLTGPRVAQRVARFRDLAPDNALWVHPSCGKRAGSGSELVGRGLVRLP
jgi:hypothetical protein